MKPQQQNYSTRAEYRWARKQYNRRHGGSMLGSIAVAVFFGLATHSTALLFGLVAFAVLAHVSARSDVNVQQATSQLTARRARRAGLQWRCEKHRHAMARSTAVCPIDHSPCGYYPKEQR